MARRHTASTPHSQRRHHSSHNHRRHHNHDQHSNTGPKVHEKEPGFDWTDGILLALVGTLTLIDRDLKKTRGRSVDDQDKESRKSGSSGRRGSDISSHGDIDERYYEYGPRPGSREQIRTK